MNQENINQEKSIDIQKITTHYLSYWKWIALSIIITIGLACLYLIKTNKSYQINTSIIIKDEESGASELAILEDFGLSTGKNIIDNETQILQSADLIKEAVIDIDFHVAYYKEDRIKQIRLNNPPIKILMDDNLITSPFSISIHPIDDKFTAKVFYKGNIIEQTFDKFPTNIHLPFGFIVLQKENTIPLNYNLIINVQSPEDLAISLSNNIKIIPTSKNSSVLNISLTSECPNQGEAFLSSLVNKYNLQAEKDKNQIAYNTSLFIDDRVKSLSVELSSVEKNVEKFKSDNKITDISSEADLFLNQTGVNEEKIKEAENQLNIIEYVESFINDETNKDRLIPNLGITDMGLSSLINKYNELLLEKDRLQRASTTANPVLERTIEQLLTMRKGIRNSIVSVRKTISITKKNLDKDGQQTTGKIQQIPRIEREFLEIKRQQQIKESLYLFLLQKREETNLTLAATAPKAKIISQPRSGKYPISPKKGIILLGALIIGLAFPILIIYLLDALQTSIKNKEDLESKCAAPLLGEIPLNKTEESIIVKPDSTSTAVELFRSLRNDLIFILKSSNKKIITITSTVSNEGKTFISANLVHTFALLEKKVLLVGLDIRNPSLAKLFNLQNKEGITTYLSSGGNIDSFIVTSDKFPNLDILQAGFIPPNPNELLSKQRLDDIFSELRNRYDYIIIDTPPIGIVSDVLLINRISDLTLYITRESQTSKESINFINNLYEEKRLNDIYVVLNGVNMEKKHHYYYRGYYYGYYYNNYHQGKKKKHQNIISKLWEIVK